jgi:hypothetical protein
MLEAKMLRRLLWSGIYSGLAAGAALVARQLAARAWRLTTGEHPPEERA